MRPDPTGRSFLVRQPLLDAQCQVAGYDLSLRDRVPVPLLPGAESFEQARDEFLITSVIDLEYQKVLEGRLVVLGLAPTTLSNPLLAGLPTGKVAVALPATWPDLAEHSSRLAEMGLLPMLEDDAEQPPLRLPPACQLVRLDSARFDAMEFGRRSEHFRTLGAKRLIAANGDAEDAFDVCRRMGFDLVQGDFLGRPRPGQGSRLDGGVMQVMELLNLALQRAPIERLEQVFKSNAALTYRLLRYINSPANGLDRPVESIGQALMWLGHDPLYRWLTLLMFNPGKTGQRDGALLKNALVRARFMENLGSDRVDRSLRGGLFIVGILSHLDALLNMPMAKALSPLHLSAPITEAILESKGPYAPYLKLAVACEHFDQETVEGVAQSSGLDAREVNLAHVNALIWSEALEGGATQNAA